MDAGSGTTATDVSGHGLNGTLTNGATWGTGRYGSAVALDAIDDLVSLGNPSGQQLTVSMTISAWRGRAFSQAIYSARNIKAAAAGANTVTAQFSSAVPYPDVRIAEYSGPDALNPFDAASSNSATGPRRPAANVSTTSASELLVGAGMTSGAFNGSSAGFTARIITPIDADIVNDRLVTSVGTYSAGATHSGSANWGMQVATFRAAGQ